MDKGHIASSSLRFTRGGCLSCLSMLVTAAWDPGLELEVTKRMEFASIEITYVYICDHMCVWVKWNMHIIRVISYKYT